VTVTVETFPNGAAVIVLVIVGPAINSVLVGIETFAMLISVAVTVVMETFPGRSSVIVLVIVGTGT